MTVETITRGGWTCDILFGYGRLLRARAILVSNVPESLKKLQLMNPDADEKELTKKVTPEELVQNQAANGEQIASLVLNRATDWDKSQMTVEEYVSNHLPPDVGEEIVQRVSLAVSALGISNERKKNSA